MEEIDLKEIFQILWKKKLIIIFITLFFTVIVFTFSSVKYDLIGNLSTETLYFARTNFIVGTSNTQHTEYNNETAIPTIETNNRITSYDSLRQTYFNIIKSPTTLNKTIEELNLDIDENELSDLIYLSLEEDNSAIIGLVVSYKDEDTAIKIANTLMSKFIKNMENIYPMDKISVIDSAYLISKEDFNDSIDSTDSEKPLSLIEKYTSITAIIAFLVSCGVVLCVEMCNDTIKNESYLEKDSLLDKINKEKNNDNAFKILSVRLSNLKTLLITSTDNFTDTDYISNNLAISYANNKGKVLLIDLTSNESNLLKKQNGKGLSDFINNKNQDKNIEKYISKSTNNNLDLLLLGSSNEINLVENQVQTIMNKLENDYNVVIINSKDIFNNPNSLIFSKVQKNTILISTEMKTKMKDLHKANKVIEEIDAKKIGNILID